MAKKSIVEEALLEAKQLEEALKKNSKEILAATMKQDIDEMVKASLNEGDEMAEETEELENESQMEVSEDESSTMVMDEQLEDSEESSEESSEEESEESSEEESEESSEEESGEGLEGIENIEMDFPTEEPETEETEDTEVVDMTGASDHELISVFKKMSDNDEIEVVKTGNNVNLKDKSTGAEYMIKMDESIADEGYTDDEDETFSYDEMMNYMKDEDESTCDECGWEENSENSDETIYEIEFDDEDDEGDEDLSSYGIGDISKMPKDVKSEYPTEKEYDSEEDFDFNFDSEENSEEDSEEFSQENSDEGTRRTMADRRKIAHHPQNYPVNESIKSEYKKVIKEYEDLKDKYTQTKEALKVFRDKLSEIALFNSNLTHAVKLFMEHATTKTEKTAIMKRFDEEATTLKESKRLYKTMTNELKDRKPISEKVEKKINESLTKASSDTLIESRAYVDPQISKIHDLMEKLDNRK